jgi:cysteine desulfuration protein SufE
MTLPAKRDQLIGDLRFFDDPQDRLAFVVDAARKRPPLDDRFKTDEFKVEGCLSNLWFVPEYRDRRCWFRSDGDSMIVKGIAGLLTDFYSGERPADILKLDPSFLAQAGITQHLSPNRKNGLARVWRKIQQFASAHLDAAGGSTDV